MKRTKDQEFMKKALTLAARGKGRTSPNPAVGAVLVKKEKIIASDYHKKAGTPHAEVLALNKAGDNSRNSTLYINLEPCCHTHKRTPPCTKVIIQSGVRRVVVAMKDPNPLVAGKGIKTLQKAGIETETGLMEKEARILNEAFSKYILKKEPFVYLKIAQSLDGKIATSRGESKWITGVKARKYVHRLRGEVDALLVGIGTVEKDNPSLDCRISRGRNPYRVIIDSLLKISMKSKVLGYKDCKTIIATTEMASKKKIERLSQSGIKVLIIKSKKKRVDLKKLMKELGKLEITSVMVEGGSSITASALADGIVDKVLFFTAPKIIGGVDAIPSVGGKSLVHLKNAFKLRNVKTSNFGDDILVEGYLS